MAFTPFMQSSKAQSIINDYLGGKMNATPNVNSAGKFRNPIYDLRTEQEKAGTLDPSADFPNPQLDFSQPNTPVDPCQEGYMLVDGICQPIETFGRSAYDENRDRDDNQEEPRKYYSIDAMKGLSDEDLIDYLKDGWLKNSPLGFLDSKGSQVTLGGQFMPLAFQLPFGKQNQMRRDAMDIELRRRGYFTGQYDNNNNPIYDLNQEPNVFLTPPATTNEAEVPYYDGSTGGSYGGGEDFGGGNVVISSNNPNNNNFVNYTQNPGNVGTMQTGGGIANPHTQSGFSGGNPFITPPQMTASQQQYMEDYDK